MENNSKVNVSCSGTLLFFVFLILKLTNTIDWSWWWITAPLWIPATFFILWILILLLINLNIKIQKQLWVGGADAAPSFLSKVVEAVSKVNTLKDNIPGMGGLLGMLGSFDQKHQIPEKGAEESTKEEE